MVVEPPIGSPKGGFLAVYLTDHEDLHDVGDDPCFSPPAPSWGICRPDVRSRLEVDQSVLFVAFHRPTKTYYARAILRVSEIISHVEAARRLPGRNNLLLTRRCPGPVAKWRHEPWRHPDLEVKRTPRFLVSAVDSAGRRWFHSPQDAHEIDNWKCRRIFLCRRPRLERCLRGGQCEKEGQV